MHEEKLCESVYEAGLYVLDSMLNVNFRQDVVTNSPVYASSSHAGCMLFEFNRKAWPGRFVCIQ